MPLTTGRLGERRRLGGRRGALRTEIRRAERGGNRRLAGELGAALAAENLTRADAGDSNLGSADSDIREGRATAFLNRQATREKATLASQAVPDPVSTQTPSRDDSTRTTPSPETGPFTQPARPQTGAPSVDPTPVGGVGDTRPADPNRVGVAGGGGGSVPTGSTGISAVEPGKIDGVPAAQATGESEFRNIRAGALARQGVPNFELDPRYEAALARSPDEGEAFLSQARREYFDEFEQAHGTDALLSTLRQRQTEFDAVQAERDRAREFDQAVAQATAGEREQSERQAEFGRRVEGVREGIRDVATGVVERARDIGEAAVSTAREVGGALGELRENVRPASVDRLIAESPAQAQRLARAEAGGKDAQFFRELAGARASSIRAALTNIPGLEQEVAEGERDLQELRATGQTGGLAFRRAARPHGHRARLLQEARPVAEAIEETRETNRQALRRAGGRVRDALRRPFSGAAADAAERSEAQLNQ